MKRLINCKKNGDVEPFIIGGGEIYKLSMKNDLIDRVYLTRIHHVFEGDTFFPNLSEEWRRIVGRIVYQMI